MRRIKNYILIFSALCLSAQAMVRTLSKPAKRVAIKSSAIAAGVYAVSPAAKAEVKNDTLPSFEKQRQEFYAQLRAKPWGKIAQKHIELFEKEEKVLMEEFFNEMKITPKEFEQLQDFIKNNAEFIKGLKEKNASGSALAQQDEQRIKEILKKLDFQGDIGIFASRRAGKLMYTTGNALFIDASYCMKLDNETLQAFVAHELAHIMHHDPFRLACIKFRIAEFAKSRPDYTFRLEYSLEYGCAVDGYVVSYLKNSALLEKLHHFIEYRADILACLTSIEAACEAYNFFAELASRYSYSISLYSNSKQTHPSDQLRAERIKAVRDEMILAVHEKQKSR